MPKWSSSSSSGALPHRGGGDDFRVSLAAALRGKADRCGVPITAGDADRPAGEPWTGQADQLERGEPVTLYAFQLPLDRRARYALCDRLILHPDGAVTLAPPPDPS